MMKILFVLGLVCLIIPDTLCMSEAQLKNGIKLIRNVCQNKLKLTNAQIDDMHKGIFANDEKQKCYMSCGLHSMKFLKNGKMDYEFAKGEVKKLPPSMMEAVGKAIDDCKDSTTSDDKCEAAYQLAQCMYKSSPQHYFLP